MLFLKRRRLLFWLIKAYFRKKGKTILTFFLLGFLISIVLILSFSYFLSKISFNTQERIGVVGAYTLDNLPSYIQQDFSMGLTTLASDGTPKPGIAKSWIIEQNGKVYKFVLRNDLTFSDGSNLTSDDINYKFADVTVERPAKYAIIFRLKDSYSPFLITVTHPVFKNNFVGVGNYTVKEIKLNGNFVQTIRLTSTQNPLVSRTYQFYPTQDALKSAYVLGEINKIYGLDNTSYAKTSLDTFNNTAISKQTSPSQLVTVFFNTSDNTLSDKKVREALTYALPDTFPQGKRNYTPYPPNTWYSQGDADFAKVQDFSHASLLLQSANINKSITINLKTFPQYLAAAEIIKKNWAKINVKANIEVVDAIPGNFQAFLYAYNVPKDPDQYTLWHSGQPANITNYRNLRIDKLLEDGRKTSDIEQRKKIYTDFEKYLIDDAPAAFLYFPYQYTVMKK